MPLKTSSFKQEIVKQDFRNVGWISIVYLLALLFLVPFQLITEFSSEYGPEPSEAGLFGYTFSFEIQALFLFIMPGLMAIFLFRYLHVKGASDFIHSLPLRREKLLHYHIGSGIVLLVIPILLTGLILWLFYLFADVSAFYTLPELGYWISLMVIVTLLVFIVGVFVGMLTGLSAVQGVLTYVLLLFPAGICGLVSFNLSSFVIGFSGDTIIQTLERYSPIINVMEYHPRSSEEPFLPVGYLDLGAYIGVAVILYVASRFIYKKRPLESASQAIALTSLKPFFKYGVTFCFMLVGGMYFGETQRSFTWLIAGYVIGSIIGYLLAIMVLEKTWRVFSWRNLRGLFPYTVIAGLLIALVPFLMNSFESYVPKEAAIDRVFVGNSIYQYEDQAASERPMLSTEKSIEAVRELHEVMIQEAEPMTTGKRRFFIAYELENGDTVYRDYLMDREQVAPQLKKLYETKEYKESHYPVLQVKVDQVMKLSFMEEISGKSRAIVVDPSKIKAAIKQLKTDIYKQTYNEMVEEQGISSRVFIHTGDNEPLSVEIPMSYEQLTGWLKEENLYSEAFVQAEDIQRIEVYQRGDIEAKYPRQSFNQLSKRHTPLISTDNSEIAAAIQQAKETEKGDYIVGFYYSDHEDYPDEVLSFQEGEVPSFVLEYFK